MGEPLRTGLVGEEADAIMGAAQRAGPRVGRAPDTVLGPGTRTARKAVDAHGSEGSLSVPDPDTFDGSVEPWRGGARERTSLPVGTTCSRPEPVAFVGELSASAGHG
ncbi:hypothetical protein [Streptomyces sp. NEAU-YJ-81]|uniref:hypothetical protein n=1 Tax=Streptomyces sp. NEAU-YJ-81 TaxID=2820288 RepID=UPI001FBBCB5B|nr:hypothetical protein [Streptomyces sp. NEAU-YJ-81]